jgi:RimJ/RimL family protein N-acetyltransferase
MTKDEGQCFFIEKKDGKKIGVIMQVKADGRVGIGYDLLAEERGKGHATEAVQIITDYLFLTKNIVRIQAETDPENKASWRVLEKAGFSKEGVMRKAFFTRGQWKDTAMYSLLREDWKEPKMLERQHS